MSTGPSMSPQIPASAPQAAPAKMSSGAKVILWIVGGIAAFVVLIVVGFAALGFFVMHKAKQAGFDSQLMQKNPVYAAAKLVATANPDVQMISSNDSAGILVVRDKKTGKLTTLKFDPAKKTMVVIDENGKQATITANTDAGNIEVKSADGTFKLGAADKAPGWVPVYPGSSPQSTMSVNANGKQSGTYVFTCRDAPDKVLGYYSDSLTASGFSVTRTSGGATGGGIISAGENSGGRSVIVTAGANTAGTQVSVTYGEKKREQ